ncbi:uroporphyrinogen-III C-methyltransferase [Paenibacillus senegalensis]|uniref:uroporphyrinogen-III C-methyltransferase n=1 Tax=Paenibacillus senegalensis TaxID=1465766 RepID=UPI00028918EE|nr:uroporphyrinogen-III C-methyltransferase [Paenibacillus senegalensis]
MKQGKVYLVGAGPGDPKLITVKGRDVLEQADVVVYDRLANPSLLSFIKAEAERIYVGKRPDRHTLKQEVINQMLVDLAKQGKTVVRLKGGDPSVFGRVGEEAELLASHGIEFEMVPGVTSATAVPLYAGIPVTHRDMTSSLAIVTGHECPVKEGTNLDWAKLSTATGTLIFLMGVGNLGTLKEVLIANGKDKATPAAVIQWGTRARQRTVSGTLETIVDDVQRAGLQSPAVIIVGEVVRLRDKLNWVERKPLFGKRVLVTRTRGQASELANRIYELGGEAIELPLIRIQRPASEARLERIAQTLSTVDRYDWILFTSVNGVAHFFEELRLARLDVRRLAKARIAAVGPKTAEALLERGLIAEQPEQCFQAEGLLEALRHELKAGQKVLLPRSEQGRAILPEQLAELGLEVTDLPLYENVLCHENKEELLRLLKEEEVDMITFTSSSTVNHLFELLGEAGVTRPLELLHNIEIVCIGPVTAKTAGKHGLTVHRQAAEATLDSLIEALCKSSW